MDVSEGNAEPLGRPPGRGSAYWLAGRWYQHDWGRILARLGKATDADLAREIGVTHQTVWAVRRRLRIPAYDKLKQVEPYLGRVSDRKLARHFGYHADTIARRRRRLGVPPCNQSQANSEALLREYLRRIRGE